MLFLSVILTFLTLGALWLAAVLNEHDMHPMRRLAELMKRPALEVALVALVAVGLIHHGATKGTNGVNGAGGEMGGTNGVQNVGGFLTGLTGLTGFGNGGGQGLPALPTTNYQLSTTNLDWLAFGGYVDWFRVDDGAWCFRFGSNLVERVTVFSCGEIASAPFGASNRISLLGLPLSIVPAANWHLLNYQLPTTNYQLKSLFWHTATPSNTLLLTWENALVRRDTNLPVTIQAEMFPDGAAAFRYDFSSIDDISALSNAETQIWRDGVLASNYQLSTTNYQQNCFFAAPAIVGTNALDEVQARIAGGNTNAYYCADVVVAKGPSKIRVEPMADETNRGLLGAYEIVAMPGETNRLPLLIGPKYTVSAEVAFESFELVPPPFVPLADDTGTVERLEFGEAFSATNVSDRLVEVQWPVEFALEEIDATPEATGYAMRIAPNWLNGVVTLHGALPTNSPPMRGAPPMRDGGGELCDCGCLEVDDTDTIWHTEDCECGVCPLEGDYAYEGYCTPFNINMKDPAIGGDSSEGGDGGEPDDPDEPSVSVSFENNFVIFEDAYEDSPGGVLVPRFSTTTKLTLYAYGGENGGTLHFELGGGLVVVPGSSPRPTSVPAYESVEWEVYCEATNASSRLRGAVAKARMTEYLTGGVVNAKAARATAVEIKLHPMTEIGNCPNRHNIGVCEIVECLHAPKAAPIVWDSPGEGNGIVFEDKGKIVFSAPITGPSAFLTASVGEASYSPELTVQEPVELMCSNIVKVTTNSVTPGYAGGVGMKLQLYVLPLSVSFENIVVEEVPCEIGSHSGYFTNSAFSAFWSHTYANGAGRWRNIDLGNRYGSDKSTTGNWPPQWDSGVMSWNIPIGWNYLDTTTGEPPVKNFPIQYYSVWTMSPDGTVTKSKHGHIISKSTNGVIRLDGVMVNGNSEVFDNED